MSKKKAKHNLSGTIYKNGNRYWWKVKLPGEETAKARPMIPAGSSMATNDYNVAVECAKIMLSKAVFESQTNKSAKTDNIAQLANTYLAYAREYYQSENYNNEAKQIEYSLKPLVEYYGAVNIEEFGPLKLAELSEHMIGLNWSRNLINQRIGRIKRMFKWAISRQIVSSVIYHSLLTVEGLKKGRCDAKETKPRKPIEEEYVYKTLPYMTKVIATMVELQMLTGMRPGELVIMRPGDIEINKTVWHYRPQKHKNDYRGHDRIISIGPRGQEILRLFMFRSKDSYCFSPAESEKYRLEKLSENRKTPINYGNRPGTNRKDNPQTRPGNFYDVADYGQAVRRAITAARADIKAKGGNPDIELPKWTPYQLRHTAATKARKLFNYETAGALLGHSNMSATAIYAERNQGLADEVAKKLG